MIVSRSILEARRRSSDRQKWLNITIEVACFVRLGGDGPPLLLPLLTLAIHAKHLKIQLFNLVCIYFKFSFYFFDF